MLSRRAVTAQRATSGAYTRAHATSPASSIQSTARSSRSSRCAAVVERREAATQRGRRVGPLAAMARELVEPVGKLRVGPGRGGDEMPERRRLVLDALARVPVQRREPRRPDVRLHGRGEQRRVERR